MVDLSQIVIGKVLEQKPHPTSRDHLWIHQVDIGDRVQQIIAGAPNAVPGSLVPVALPGTTVPNGKLVKDMTIAGETASGMLCSAEELLLGDDHSGILILDRGTPGAPLTSVIPSQAIMEAEITSNRPDEMGHLGVARELGAGLDRPVQRDFMPAFTGTADPPGRDLVKVAIDDPDLCSRYIGGVIKGVKVGPSPEWMQRRLRACGVRPINNIVDTTNYVLLEYAQPLHALGLRTEASARFERALPPELALAGARRAASLIAELAGGNVHREWADIYPRPQEPVRVNLKPALIDDLLGTHVPLEEAESILKRLNFHVKVQGDGEWDVLPPVFRLDVTIPEDLVEEVGRVYGYDRVPPTLPGRRHEKWTPSSPSIDRRLDTAREVLAGAGFTETWNPALVSGKKLEDLRIAAHAMRVMNALSDDMDTLRTSLLPSLIDAAALNRDRGRLDIRVYEIAAAYIAPVGEHKAGQPEEPLRLAAAASAGASADDGRIALYRLKAVLDECVGSLSAPAVAYQRAAAQLFHPGRCAAVVMDGRQLGYIGEVHPSVSAGAKLDGRYVAFEIDVEPLLAAARIPRAQALPRFPAVERDLAVVVEETVAAAAILAPIKEAAGDLLEHVRAFDEYRGAQVPEGHKSIAFTLTFRSPERTLTDAEVDRVMSEIKLGLEKRHRARFRE